MTSLRMLLLLATLAALSSACEGEDELQIIEPSVIEGPADTIAPPMTDKLKGKTLFTLFDSFGAGGQWQQVLADTSGCIFDPDLNYNQIAPISYGGTPTLSSGWCAQRRALNLAQLKATQQVDYIFVENVNDVHYMTEGSIDQDPWMLQQEVNLVPDHELTSSTEAYDYWISHFNELVASLDQPKNGTMLILPYATSHSGYKLVINQLPTSDGTLLIHVGYNTFGITVTAGMSLEQLMERILEYNYGSGWTDVQVSDHEVVISYYSDAGLIVSVDTGTTGLDISVQPSSSFSSIRLYFVGKDPSQFSQFSCWKKSVSLYAQYKGLFEFLLQEFPQAHIFQFIPTYYYGESTERITKLFDWQIEVAQYYGIPVLDMRTESGITDDNYTDYYSPGDVHPRQEGYKCWAEAIYRLLQ